MTDPQTLYSLGRSATNELEISKTLQREIHDHVSIGWDTTLHRRPPLCPQQYPPGPIYFKHNSDLRNKLFFGRKKDITPSSSPPLSPPDVSSEGDGLASGREPCDAEGAYMAQVRWVSGDEGPTHSDDLVYTLGLPQ